MLVHSLPYISSIMRQLVSPWAFPQEFRNSREVLDIKLANIHHLKNIRQNSPAFPTP